MTRRVFLVVAVALALTASGCATARGDRVTLAPAPESTDALERRTRYYAAHRPVVLDVVQVSGLAAPTPAARRPWLGEEDASLDVSRTLVLADGRKITHPEDLLVAVRADSAVAETMRSAARHRRQVGPWLVGGWATALAGGSLFFGSIFAAWSGDVDPAVSTMMLGAGAVLAASSLVPFAVAGTRQSAAERARDTAFQGFDDALRERLGLRQADLDATAARE